jgi:hypothetical protein
MSLRDANIIGGLAGLLGALLVLLPFWLLWGGVALLAGVPIIFSPWFIIPAFVLSIIIHEALHGVGWVLASRLPWSAISFGFKDFTPYAHCNQPMQARAYRIGTLFPVLVLGLLPALTGLALGSGALIIWAALMVFVAGGDLSIIWMLRRVPGRTLVRDHPSRAGCEVVEDS